VTRAFGIALPFIRKDFLSKSRRMNRQLVRLKNGNQTCIHCMSHDLISLGLCPMYCICLAYVEVALCNCSLSIAVSTTAKKYPVQNASSL